MTNPVVTFVVADPSGRAERIVMLGEDQTGRALEVMAVELENGTLLVIHVMDLRPKFRAALEEGRRG